MLLVAAGCATSGIQRWEQKASAIDVGTPRSEVEKALPPASVVVDPRSGPGGGQLAYWVDADTLVRFWIDENGALARPVTVEAKKRPPEANKTGGR